MASGKTGRLWFAALAAFTLAAIAGQPSGAFGSNPEPRVVGGQNTSASSYPWQAGLVLSSAKFSGNDHDRLFCGGSLIAPRIVLTAAHCVWDTDPDNPPATSDFLDDAMEPNDLQVILGRTTMSGSGGTVHAVSGISISPHWSEASFHSDFALLVLAAPSSRKPIKIAGPGEWALWLPGRKAEGTGWGKLHESDTDTSDTLQRAVLPVIADGTCGSAGVYGSAFNVSSMVCAGYLPGGRDTCAGDSGGPLQAPIDGGGRRLVGVTSWGDGCARANAPGVYTRVAGATLRQRVKSRVSAVEAAFGLAHREVYGAGAELPGARAARLRAKKKAKARRIRLRAKCKRARTKHKRQRCRVKYKL